jgi:23S rRNA (guanosine2251-2'-O)-methyltransferase
MARAHWLTGFHAVTARLRAAPASIVELLCEAGRDDARMRTLLRLAEARGVRVMRAEPGRLEGLAHGGRHQGVAARVSGETQPPPDLDELLDALPGTPPPLLVVLDGIQDPRNLGAILRVADAMGVDAVIAPRDRAVGITETVARVASGAAETVRYLTVVNLARALDAIRARGIWCVGASEHADAELPDAKLDGPLAWVFGAEGEGLRRLTRERCDELARIPIAGTVGSLNVSVAAGVCLYETRRQRRPAAPAALARLTPCATRGSPRSTDR